MERSRMKLPKRSIASFHPTLASPISANKPTSFIINERAPYIDYVIPLFKYFASTTKLMSLLRCEKGLPSLKLLAICLPDDSAGKLVDGIGIIVGDKLERILIESSGEADGDYCGCE
ncbi:hypothetical protein PS15p_201690 [Mucor circinelloides]